MHWSVRSNHNKTWILALVLLVLSCAFAACGRNSANQAAPVIQNNQVSQSAQPSTQSTSLGQPTQSSAPSQQSSSSSTQSGGSNTGQIQDGDQQAQKALQSLDNAQNDVTTSSSTQENEQQP